MILSILRGITLLLRGMVLQIQMSNPKWPGAVQWINEVQSFIGEVEKDGQ